MYGLVIFLFSAVTEAARCVYNQRLLGAERYNTAEVLVYVSFPSAAVLIGCSMIWEWEGIKVGGGMLFTQPKQEVDEAAQQ